MGQWTGTSGTLAADVIRLLKIIETKEDGMKGPIGAGLIEANDSIRVAVAEMEQARGEPSCCAGGRMPVAKPEPDDYILRAERELKGQQTSRPLGAGVMACDQSPAESLLERAIETIVDRRGSYGPPKEHFDRTVAAINAIFSHKLVSPLTAAEWAQIMILDKLARHQGTARSSDTPIDIAGYAACLAECEALPDRTGRA